MDLYEIEVEASSGERVNLSRYRGSPLLIVNVASRCGFTPQYKDLEALYRRYKNSGLVVLGFPCNQFAGQEPGNDDEIRTFCSTRYDVSFPIFRKIEVNGPRTHPLYRLLKRRRRGFFGSAVKWNFTKFLVDCAGNVVGRYAPWVSPARIAPAIERLLRASAPAGDRM